MEKCKYCGKEYRENPMSHIEKLPEFIKEKIKYIPDCNCLEEISKKEMEELEKKRVYEMFQSELTGNEK